MKLYAWVGEDEHHNGEGLKMVLTPLGPQNAVFATEKLAMSSFVLDQMQRIANAVNRPMRLDHRGRKCRASHPHAEPAGVSCLGD
jgi:hypothetical protein